MKDFNKYYSIVSSTADTTGQRPSVRDYVLIKLVDNVFIILLVVLTLAFAWYGLSRPKSEPDQSKWALNAASLCLGVFLGLFAGRKV
jgi:hypothetical protein